MINSQPIFHVNTHIHTLWWTLTQGSKYQALETEHFYDLMWLKTHNHAEQRFKAVGQRLFMLATKEEEDG
jgi:hypothetical protein